MPAAVDHPAVREQVRLLYIGNGRNLTLAAKTVGVPVDRAEKWKERGHWDQRTVSDDPATAQLSVSESVGTTADNLAKTLADDSNATKIGFSTAARKVAAKIAELKPNLDKDRAQAVRHWAGVASTVHGWDESKGADRRVMINIGILNE